MAVARKGIGGYTQSCKCQVSDPFMLAIALENSKHRGLFDPWFVDYMFCKTADSRNPLPDSDLIKAR